MDSTRPRLVVLDALSLLPLSFRNWSRFQKPKAKYKVGKDKGQSPKSTGNCRKLPIVRPQSQCYFNRLNGRHRRLNNVALDRV